MKNMENQIKKYLIFLTQGKIFITVVFYSYFSNIEKRNVQNLDFSCKNSIKFLPNPEGELRKLAVRGSKGLAWSDGGATGGNPEGVVISCGLTDGEDGGGYIGRSIVSGFTPPAELAFSGFCFAWWW